MIYVAYLLLLVWLIPGNSFGFQLQLSRPQDHVLFGALSHGTALLVLMQAFLFRRTRAGAKLVVVGRGSCRAYVERLRLRMLALRALPAPAETTGNRQVLIDRFRDRSRDV